MASTGTRSVSVPLPHFRARDRSGDARCSVASLALKAYELDSVGVRTQILDLARHS